MRPVTAPAVLLNSAFHCYRRVVTMRLSALLLVFFVYPPLAFVCPPLAFAEQTAGSAGPAALQERADASRREQQELRERSEALRAQQCTTESVLDKQQEMLDQLHRQLREIKDRRQPSASR
ncbi:hypothetical protein CEK62_10095 [Alcanivorax sp. N3-2A]|nr:hypothetical protein CEK62_10095 [Alcanivorax sp. N3-2A]